MTYNRVRSRASPSVEESGEITGTISGTFGPYVVREHQETMHDVVTPGYRSIIDAGGIVNNPCVYTSYRLESEGTGTLTAKGGSNDYTLTGPVTWLMTDQTWLPIDIGEVHCSASEAKFWALSNVDRTPYAFGEDLLEIGETIRFLRNPLGSLRNMSRLFRSDVNRLLHKKIGKRHIKDRRKYAEVRAQAVADTYLQYRFAFSPLVRSVSDAFDAISHKDDRPLRLSARGRSEDSASSSERVERLFSANDGYAFNVSKSKSISYRASILYEITNPVRDWRYTFGLRNQDIPETLWQVLPYSFMIDRIANISGAIRGLTALANPKLKILAGSVTLREESVHSMKAIDAWNDPHWTRSADGETRTRTDFKYERNPWTPQLSDAIPPVKLGGLVDDATKTADLAALIIKNLR